MSKRLTRTELGGAWLNQQREPRCPEAWPRQQGSVGHHPPSPLSPSTATSSEGTASPEDESQLYGSQPKQGVHHP